MPQLPIKLSPGIAARAGALRLARASAAFTHEAATSGHVPQLRYVLDTSRYVLAMCSRRAGKTTGNAFKMAHLAKSRPKSHILYLALTRGQAKQIMWVERVWLDVCQRWFPEASHNIADLTTTFPNGSVVKFGGTDDIAHVETKLGSKLHLAIVDEAQSQKYAVLERLTQILTPALSDDGGTLVFSGTIPEAPAGFFWEKWSTVSAPGTGWAKHSWSRFDNPHMADQRQKLAEDLAAMNLEESDPLIQRDWYGRCVFDPSAVAFRYDAARNGYDALDEHDVTLYDTFAVGIDPGARDRCAIVVIGWGKATPTLCVVEEWVTKRNAGTAWSDIGRELRRIQKKWNPAYFFYDAGGSSMTLDVLGRDFGVPVLMAAKKTDKRGGIDRVNDALQRGIIRLPVKSELAQDFLKTQWDKESRARGGTEWSSHNHPDVADAFRYATQAYFEAFVPKPTKMAELERLMADDVAHAAALFSVPVKYGTFDESAYGSTEHSTEPTKYG